MSHDTISNVIGRINKLRELSKNNQNEFEAANAAAAAALLVDRFQLSEMDLQVKGDKIAEAIEEIQDPLYRTGRAMAWIDSLTRALCDHYGCTGYWKHVTDPMGIAQKNPNAVRDSYKAYTLVGRRSDAAIIEYMFNWLQPVIIDLMKKNAYGRGMKFSQNYALGVVSGIKFQLEQENKSLRQEAELNNQSAAMVLLGNRCKDADVYMRKTVPGLQKRYHHLDGDVDARERGVQDGKAIHLSKGISASAGPRLLK